MAKKAKVKTDKVVPPGTVEEGLAMLIEMESNELQALIRTRNLLTNMCVNKKATLVLFGKMTGLETSMLESLKIE